MQDQKKWAEPLKNPWLWAIPTIATILLIIISRFSFLTFHTLAELITIIIAFNITAFAWSTHDFTKNNFLMFLACGYFWIALLDLIHTLVYKGMDVFIAGSGNLSVQFWLSARYLEALLLFIAPLAASRNLNRYTLLGGFGIIAIALSALVFSGDFPTGFVEGTGLTDFKIYSEYLIDLILVGALVVLFRYGTGISIEEKVIIGASILLTVMAELAFTFYVSVYGLSNLAGHIFKLFSYWFIFHAIFLHNLRNPYTALQKSEDLFRRTFENSGIAITIRSARDRSLLMNKAFQKMTGYSDEEMRGIHLRTITHPDEWEENENIRRRVYEENVQNVQVTRRLVRKNGDTIFVINEMSAIRDDKGELEYLVSLYQDITEYKQAEEKLHQEQKMEAVGQLTGGIAHDFNNLLAVCMGNIELAQEESQRGGNVQPALNTVMRAIERGAALTRQLLAFSRKQTLTPQTVNVEKLVAGMSELLRSALGETIEIDLKTARDPAPWPCLVDPHQLESAILNLAINARDAMPDGGK
ncbi:MAG: PAS domain S-box protein, partial [Rhodospirillales bacterium]|nr:PAS domain S-box protein [Rhodospirillales bacterium]